MLSCWLFESERRPSFEQILNNLVTIYKNTTSFSNNAHCLPISDDNSFLSAESSLSTNVATAATGAVELSQKNGECLRAAVDKKSIISNNEQLSVWSSGSPTETTFLSTVQNASL
jgi:hypothetical protein